jgi:hypothetical protein
MRPPQPFAASPQFWPAGHAVAGVHGTLPSTPRPLLPPHLLTPPPPQNCGSVQVPQLIRPPQPSAA